MNDPTDAMARTPSDDSPQEVEKREPEAEAAAPAPGVADSPEAEGADRDDDEDEDGEERSPESAEQGAEPTTAPNEPAVRFEDVISGRFDAEEEAGTAPPKRVLAPQPETP